MMKQIQAPAPASLKAVEESCVTCGGAHSYRQCPTTNGNTFTGYHDNIQGYVLEAATTRTKEIIKEIIKTEELPSNTVSNPREELKAITTRSGVTLARPSVSPSPHPSKEALAHMPKFAKMVKDLLKNKEKLLEVANTPVNENCSVVILKKLPKNSETLGATRTVDVPAGIAEDVFFQVGKFTFPTEFMVVDYEVDPRVPLILGRPFLRTAHALVDVHGEKLTLRVSDEELSHSYFGPYGRVSLSPSLTPFGDSDFLLEETEAFISLNDSIPPGIDDGTYDSEGDILFLERLLNNDPTLDLPPIPYPVCLINDVEKIKSSIDDPPDLELKDLPSHLEYAFLEGTS
nr:hypothetical protein [Tanacetum cinerariifolium]